MCTDKQSIKTFIEAFDNFHSLSHIEKIILFGYYLQTKENLEQFSSAEILKCYDAVDLPSPSNIADLISKAKLKKRLIPKDGGYRISIVESQRIEKTLGGDNQFFGDSNMQSLMYHSFESAVKVAQTISQLEKKKQFHPGLYYIVLIDLVGSTKASAELGPQENIDRINQFVEYTKAAWKKMKNMGSVQFIKDVGDASLFTFSNFEDILEWSKNVDELLTQYNNECDKQAKLPVYKMFAKKCVHLGEVHFNKGSDPIAFAINQLFKIEKEFTKDQLGITDSVKQVILPRIRAKEISLTKVHDVILPGDDATSALWHISK